MKIKCDQCNKIYNVPDEKLPFGKKFSVPCLNCKAMIELDLREAPVKNDSAANAGPVNDQPEDEAPAPTTKPNQNKMMGMELKKKLLKDFDKLPAMPQIVFKAYELMDDPGSSAKQIAGLIETDQAIATEVLKIANSVYYGISGKVGSVQQASVVLGFKSLREVITLAGTSTLMGKKLFGYEIESKQLWRHSMLVAFGSKVIAQKTDPSIENDTFSAGLIHDLGKIVLDRPILNRKEIFQEFIGAGDRTFLAAEQKILGFDHADVGFEICKHWSIPKTIAAAVKHHHQPLRSSDNKIAYIVSLGNSIAHMADSRAMLGEIESDIGALMYLIDDEVLEYLGLTEKDVGVILDKTISSVDKIVAEIESA